MKAINYLERFELVKVECNEFSEVEIELLNKAEALTINFDRFDPDFSQIEDEIEEKELIISKAEELGLCSKESCFDVDFDFLSEQILIAEEGNKEYQRQIYNTYYSSRF